MDKLASKKINKLIQDSGRAGVSEVVEAMNKVRKDCTVDILRQAICENDLEMLNRVVQGPQSQEYINKRYEYGFAPLHLAVFKNNKQMVKLLCGGKTKPDVNIKDDNGNTPLNLASKNKEIAMLLIDHGADPCHKGPNGISFATMISLEDPELARELECAGEDYTITGENLF